MTNSFPNNPYVQDILDQPGALNRTLSSFRRSNFSEFPSLAGQLRSGVLRRIVLTGMGSSYHAFYPLFLGLLQRGLQAQMIETSELVHYAAGLISPDTLIVLASQSGHSAEVVQLLKRIPDGCPLIGITNTADSPLASRAGAVLLTQAGPEYSVSCKTYVTALAALAVLEKLLTGGDPGPVLADLEGLPAAVSGYLSRLEGDIEQVKGKLEGVRYLVLAGRGPSLAAAGTGGLIIKEAAHFPTEGMSCAAFRHGPLDLVSPETFVLVYEGLPATAGLNANLMADIQRAGGRSALVTTGTDEDAFHLPAIHAEGQPILEILPAQILSLALSLLRGHTPGQFSLGTKVTSVE